MYYYLILVPILAIPGEREVLANVHNESICPWSPSWLEVILPRMPPMMQGTLPSHFFDQPTRQQALLLGVSQANCLSWQ